MEAKMSVILWGLVGLLPALIASRVVKTTGEGTVVDLLIGIVGAVGGGGLFAQFGGSSVTGLNIDSVYSAGAAMLGAILLLVIYHVFFRRRMR
jgi:uncharacterized membrane protein YeaQ/YmgE (transglycosylase-associated protein family)